ncbi:MAG: ATP-binding cassette domain-containing protein [Deltaproteobacteria bacterium]|nr:ATP-binding cassette domain-containing protein [Deltaproteobacteria bacterium]
MILEARGLSRRYGRVWALDQLGLAVARGEIVGLLGPNGAGKSTAFRLLAGLEAPDRGGVYLDGVDVTRWPLHRRANAGLAYLPQHPSVLPRLTAAENVGIALGARGRDPSGARRLLEGAGLETVADRASGRLSGGERRRVEIVRCLALQPRVLLLDEPFAGVDPIHVEALQGQIRAAAASGCAVLLTDHAVREALRACDRATLLDEGVVQMAGTPAEIVGERTARARYLGESFEL